MSSARTQATKVIFVMAQRDLDAPLSSRDGWRGRLDELASRAERGIGGVQVAVRQFHEALERVGTEVSVVTPFDGWFGPPLAASALAKVLTRMNPAWGLRWHRWWRRTLASRNARRHVTDAPGVVWFPQDPGSAEVSLAHRRPGQRIVALCHYGEGSEGAEMVLRGVLPEGHPLVEATLRRERATLSLVDGLLFVSDIARRATTTALGGHVDVPTAVVPNIVDDGIFRPDLLPAPSADLVSVGVLNPLKRHHLLVEAVAEMMRSGRSVTLTLVGGGPSRGDLEELAASLGVSHLVHLVGQVDSVPDVLIAHRCYVHSSSAETFGISVAEAMAVGLPVAVVPVGGLAEVVRDGIDGIHLDADPAVMAAQILALLDAPDRMTAMGAAGRARVDACYRADVVGPQLLSVLSGHESLVGGMVA